MFVKYIYNIYTYITFRSNKECQIKLSQINIKLIYYIIMLLLLLFIILFIIKLK